MDVQPTGTRAMHQLIVMERRSRHRRRRRMLVLQRRLRNRVGAIQVHVEFAGIAAVEPLSRSNFPTDVAGKSFGIRIGILESEIEIAGAVRLEPDLEWFGGAAYVEIVLAAGTVVVPGVAGVAAGVAAKSSAGIGGGGEEREGASAVGGVGDELRQLCAGLVEGEVAGRACVHDSAGLELASGAETLRVVERKRMELVWMSEVLEG